MCFCVCVCVHSARQPSRHQSCRELAPGPLYLVAASRRAERRHNQVQSIHEVRTIPLLHRILPLLLLLLGRNTIFITRKCAAIRRLIYRLFSTLSRESGFFFKSNFTAAFYQAKLTLFAILMVASLSRMHPF